MFPRLTSVSNPRVKRAVRLQNGRERRKEGVFLIDGFREIRRAFESGFVIQELFLSQRLLESETRTADLEFLLHTVSGKCDTFALSDPVFEKLAFGQRREGAVAIAAARHYEWKDVQLSEKPLLAVVEGVEKPGNLGAIYRSADGAGVELLLIADPLCDLYNPNTIRASLGTVFRIPAILGTSEEIFHELLNRKIRIAAARCDDSTLYTNFDFTQSCAIALGTEAEGLSPIWHRQEVQPVHLPMLGIADSLNVAGAAAVLFYEARRQRTQHES